MRQAYDYWQDQPGSPRRGDDARGTPTPRSHSTRSHVSPRPAFDTGPTRPARAPNGSERSERPSETRRRCQSRGAPDPTKGSETPKGGITNATPCANSNETREGAAHRQLDGYHRRGRNHDERRIKRPLKERSPTLGLGSASHRARGPSTHHHSPHQEGLGARGTDTCIGEAPPSAGRAAEA